MTPFKALMRTAARLQKNWPSEASRDRNETADVERIGGHWQRLQRCLCTITKAQDHGLSLVLPSLREELIIWVKAVGAAAEEAQDRLERPLMPRPDTIHLAAELRQLEEEFGELKINDKRGLLSVTTGSITLEGVTLGCFAIELHCDRLARGRSDDSFEVVALDPHPAVGNDQVFHPHVSGTSLCAGDALLPIQRALEQGRVADAFCLVRSVLNHYNPESPYVPLNRWEGTECQDCGSVVREDDRASCTACDSDFCLDCSHNCVSCRASFCRDCLSVCAVCEKLCCNDCLRSCPFSRRDCCSGCMQVCTECGSNVAGDERDPETGLCPHCFQPEPSEETPSPSEPATLTLPTPETRTQVDETIPTDASIAS